MAAPGKKIEVDFEFHDRQITALETIAKPDVDVLLYGGGKGGGKSIFGCRWVVLKCLELIQKYKLPKTPNPPLVGFTGRKRATDLHKTTIETFKQWIPADLYTINQQHSEIVILGRVKVAYGGFDDRITVQKFNSMELVFYFLDQAEEIAEDEWGMIHATLRRRFGEQEPPAYKGLLTCNPANCWLKHRIVKAGNTKMPFLQALPSDNPYLPPDYADKLQVAFGHRPELIAAYMHGSWDSLEGAKVCIKDTWLDAAAKIHRVFPPKRVIGLDVAEYGDDECVATLLNNTDVEDVQIWGQVGRAETCNRVAVFNQKHGGGIPVIVDCDGFGIEFARGLRDLGLTVIEFWGSKPSENEPEKYYNQRAELWWGAGESFSAGDVELHNCTDELRRQLTAVEYEFRNGKLIIEPKTDIKARIGRSPDHAESYLMALWGRKYAVGENEEIIINNRRQDRRCPMAM
jgi:hypothetical protein